MRHASPPPTSPPCPPSPYKRRGGYPHKTCFESSSPPTIVGGEVGGEVIQEV